MILQVRAIGMPILKSSLAIRRCYCSRWASRRKQTNCSRLDLPSACVTRQLLTQRSLSTGWGVSPKQWLSSSSGTEIGDTDVLKAARAHIQSGKSFVAIANVSSEDNPVPRLQLAFLDLSQMDHIRQAEVLQPPPEPFDTFVIDHVRSAAASVTSLVPMMKGVNFDSCEDDLTALIGELLVARFQFLGWSVPGQSKGGFTAKGNPGERDLAATKDSTTLAVIEAVVCGNPLPNRTLRAISRNFWVL